MQKILRKMGMWKGMWEGMWEWVYMHPHTHPPTHPPTHPNTHSNNIKLFGMKIMKILITFLSISQPIFNPWGCTSDMIYTMYTRIQKKKIDFVSLKLLKLRTPPQNTLSSISQLLEHSGTWASEFWCSGWGLLTNRFSYVFVCNFCRNRRKRKCTFFPIFGKIF